MFSNLQRIQTVSGHATTAVMCLIGLITVSFGLQLAFDGAFTVPNTFGRVKPVTSVKFSRRFGSRDGKQKENSRLTFDLETDLSPLFNWNTKQVFVYLTAEYQGDQFSENKVVYWDKIIESKDDAKLVLKRQRSKYSIYDYDSILAGKDATLKLEWNIQPWVGPLVWGSTTAEKIFTYPSVLP